MEILGIGLPELGLILVVVFLVLGPKDMANNARRIARTIRTLTQSDFWRATRDAWKMAQEIPTELLRETGLVEAQKDLRIIQNEVTGVHHELADPVTPVTSTPKDDNPGTSIEPITTDKTPEIVIETTND